MWQMDPHAVLGVKPGADPDEVARAYRRAAKGWHPDANRAPDAAMRMAEINIAYELLRAAEAPGPVQHLRPQRKRRKGWWLADDVRSRLGGELLAALHEHERIELVTGASTRTSGRALLVLTDRRLVWLLDDAVGGRVRALARPQVAAAVARRSWLGGHGLRVITRAGKRLAFAGLSQADAEHLENVLRRDAAAAA
jgi:hypothetical protein